MRSVRTQVDPRVLKSLEDDNKALREENMRLMEQVSKLTIELAAAINGDEERPARKSKKKKAVD